MSQTSKILNHLPEAYARPQHVNQGYRENFERWINE